MKVRKARNAITTLKNSNGELLTAREAIQQEIIGFCKSLMVTNDISSLLFDLNTTRSRNTLSKEAYVALSQLVTHEEMERDLFSLLLIQ